MHPERVERRQPDERCWYCGEEKRVDSPEHVISRALGGGLVIRVCEECNARANRSVDDPLVRLDDVARERARVGIRDARTNRPARFSETLETTEGLKILATWWRDGIDARFLPVELPRSDGKVVDVFLDTRDAAEHERKQAERAARRGLTIGPAVDPDERSDVPEARFAPGQEFTVVARSRVRLYPAWLWPATIAKVALGCLADGASTGWWPRRTIDDITIHGLRMIAFEHRYSPELWSAEEMDMEPTDPAPTHRLAGALAQGEHLFVIYGREPEGQPPLAQLVLFGRKLLELPLPGLSVAASCAWLFLAESRRFVRDDPEIIAERLQRQSSSSSESLC